MLVAVDIGNTSIAVGVFRGKNLENHWRLSSSLKKTSDEYGVALLGLLSSAGIRRTEVSGAVVSSVVPSIDAPFRDAIEDHLKTRPRFIGAELRPKIRLLVDNPDEVGSDRVVNAVAAYSICKRAVIVVDFGTATTFDYVSGDGSYMGGVIAPGIGISSEALCQRTARLPRVELGRPSGVVGRNTVDAIRSGVFWGFAGLVDGIIERMLSEIRTKPRIMATGGFTPLVKGVSRFIKDYDEFLTLKGLKIIHEGKR